MRNNFSYQYPFKDKVDKAFLSCFFLINWSILANQKKLKNVQFYKRSPQLHRDGCFADPARRFADFTIQTGSE